MFQCCENLDAMPALPATKLAGGCYSRMFHNCSHLKSVNLPATELAPYCYYDMISNCFSLNEVILGYTGTPDEAPAEAFGGDDRNWAYGLPWIGTLYYNGDKKANAFGFPFKWDTLHY